MTDDKRRPESDPFREGVRAVTGILGALRDAIEGTFDDMSAKGDMSPERAKEAAKETMGRAQEAMDRVRDRLDFATRSELETLRAEVAELRRRLDEHAANGGAQGSTGASGGTGGGGGTGFGGTGGFGDAGGAPGEGASRL